MGLYANLNEIKNIKDYDTDKDGDITIMDATMIQRFIAQLIPTL